MKKSLILFMLLIITLVLAVVSEKSEAVNSIDEIALRK